MTQVECINPIRGDSRISSTVGEHMEIRKARSSNTRSSARNSTGQTNKRVLGEKGCCVTEFSARLSRTGLERIFKHSVRVFNFDKGFPRCRPKYENRVSLHIRNIRESREIFLEVSFRRSFEEFKRTPGLFLFQICCRLKFQIDH